MDEQREIFKFEPLVPLLLSIHGSAVLLQFSHAGWRWLGIAATILIALTGFMRRTSSVSLLSLRALALAAITLIMIAATGRTSSFFTIWCFMISATYPIIIPTLPAFAIPIALSLSYGIIYFYDPFPMPPFVIVIRCTFMVLMGWITHMFGRSLSRLSKVQRLANTDPLTGLYNRRHFFSKGENEVDRFKRFGSPLSLLLLDCDKFKNINDRFGHEMGDKVLQNIARTIKDQVRKIDVPARLGGDEFSIILPGTGKNGAENLARRLEREVERLNISGGDGCNITPSISVGIGTASQETKSLQDLIRKADKDMYKRKRKKREGEGH